jgi:ribosomal 30S subunit maturation factor RimM
LEVGDRLIPMVQDAIRSIDIEARRIDVDSEFLGE